MVRHKGCSSWRCILLSQPHRAAVQNLQVDFSRGGHAKSWKKFRDGKAPGEFVGLLPTDSTEWDSVIQSNSQHCKVKTNFTSASGQTQIS